MYKNQLQELAQRSCFNLPWYTCVREGPDHAPRFKAVVNFNGETFESPLYCSTLRQAEHSAAESALASLSSRHSLAARILDETGVYKNLLQEIAQRVGAPLPQYTTFRSGSGHLPVFTGTVELAGITFTGDPAKNKKQAEKSAALSAWLSLKQLAQQDASSSSENENNNEEIEQIRISRALQKYRLKAKLAMGANVNSSISIPFPKKFSGPTPRPSSPQRPSSKILPLFNQKTNVSQNRPSPLINNSQTTDVQSINFQKLFSIASASPYIPIRQCSREPYQGIAPPVTLRPSVPVFSSFPAQPRPVQVASPVNIRQALPVFSTPTGMKQDQRIFSAPPNKLLSTQSRPIQITPRPVQVAPPVSIRQAIPVFSAPTFVEQDQKSFLAPSNKLSPEIDVDESIAVKCLEQLEL